ncbi:short chain dehydrogenase [Reticulomyxa filosa]|uniref:Short chain dehydrogenase n=1 Tax=Reticulomyxa filosa TaxID=46433 RepID=X6NPN8_RETFI|nr:short chain dehydrogenase [Reticulomyxa filosa]|eukprot:ETO27966.1 short chain dehydrogenase [Reticulomyxa filosa]
MALAQINWIISYLEEKYPHLTRNVEKNTKPLVVITGASSGIGEECARLFSKEGHPLLLMARRIEKMEKEFENTKDVLLAKVDVTDYNQMHAALEKAEQLYGPCDCLINNAGVMLLGKMVQICIRCLYCFEMSSSLFVCPSTHINKSVHIHFKIYICIRIQKEDQKWKSGTQCCKLM